MVRASYSSLHRPEGKSVWESKLIPVPFLAADGFRLDVYEKGPLATVWKSFCKHGAVSYRKFPVQPVFASTREAIRWAEQFLEDYADCQAKEGR